MLPPPSGHRGRVIRRAARGPHKSSPGTPKIFPEGIRAFAVRNVILAIVVGASAGLISGRTIAMEQAQINDARANREREASQLQNAAGVRLENLRFVRGHTTRELIPRPFHGLDLSEQPLQGLLLEGSDLGDSNLRGANLSDTNLRSSQLENANLENAVLDRADLANVKLRSALLRNASLERIEADGGSL